jgi:hypothetical protein
MERHLEHLVFIIDQQTVRNKRRGKQGKSDFLRPIFKQPDQLIACFKCIIVGELVIPSVSDEYISYLVSVIQ